MIYNEIVCGKATWVSQNNEGTGNVDLTITDLKNGWFEYSFESPKETVSYEQDGEVITQEYYLPIEIVINL